jgi:phage gp29-like protein
MADEFVEKLTWLGKIIDETNDAVKERYRAIENEKELVLNELTRKLLQKETLSTETIAKIIGRQFCR